MRIANWVLGSALGIALSGGFNTFADWPQFRGPDGNNHASLSKLPDRWNLPTDLAWKTPLPGKGWSSPVTSQGKVWVTTAKTSEPDPQDLVRKAEKSLATDKVIAGDVELWAYGIDLVSGEKIHEVRLASLDQVDPIHSLNSYASPTPAIANGKVVCHFGRYGTWCLDAARGTVLWNVQYVIDHSVGPGSSPIIADGVVLLVCDGIDEQFVVGVDLATGKERWKTPRPPLRPKNEEQRKAYSTPLIVDSNGKKIAVIPGAQWIVAYDPQTGKEVWRADHGEGFSTTPSPILESNRIVFSTGYMRPVLVGMRLDGQGDITTSHVAWQATKGGPTISSPLGFDGRVYALTDTGILSCYDVQNGEELGKRRIGGKFAASPLLLDKKILLCGQDGKVTVLQATPELEVLAENDLGEQLMASPAVDANRLIIRGVDHLFCISASQR